MVSPNSLSTSDAKRVVQLMSNITTNFHGGSERLQSQLASLFNYDATILWEADNKGNLYNPINFGISDDFIIDYLSHFYQEDYLHPQNQLSLYRKQSVLRLEDITPLKSYERSDYYKEFMQKHQYYHEMVILFFLYGDCVGALGVARSKEENKFTNADRQRLQAMAPMIANIMYLERKYEKERNEKEMLAAFASKSDTGFVILDQHYKVVYMNSAVWSMLRENKAIESVDNFIEEIILSISHSIVSPRSFMISGYNIQIITHQERFLLHESKYAVIIEKNKKALMSQTTASLDKLTKREKEVNEYLMQGYSYKEIANHLFISVHTVNKHVKNIYKKFGVHRRSALQRLQY